MLLSCTEPAVLVAHSLGCLTIAAWAAHSQNMHLVKAALLVAPPDTAREDIVQMLPGWVVPLQKLPFKTVLFMSGNDPFCSPARACEFARAWGSTLIEAGNAGHLNAECALADWPTGDAELLRLIDI